ncbi:protease pro-enzyme activation domain-containing protein [Paraburkholderia phytofirmans]|uniref:Peptidase S53 activation domain-containing protein n=2 Tax=Paraburkholderia phytofirmans TaxID=261302 RepID=A0A160FV79_9BURK|nr:hypothetical protein AYM40_34610 [Paraburkholderia phytofirmans OLGA172]
MLVALGSTVSESMAQTARQLVAQVIDERQTVELAGNTRPEVNAGGDRGRVEDTLVLEHMQLLLKRPAEREAALVRFIDQLHDSKSPYFHQWLTAEQFRANFGPADADVGVVIDRLSRHGLTVNGVQAGAELDAEWASAAAPGAAVVLASCGDIRTTLGDMDVNCSGTNGCYRPSGNYGVLSTSNSSYSKAYGTGAGWNFATGIGTVNVTNLVNAWPR